jgi:hypothetical protein
MSKHYRVKKDTFLWKAGAILQEKDIGTNSAGYVAVEDVWDAVPTVGGEYISSRIIEHPDNADYFERVYPDTLKGKLFHTKDQLVELYNGAFK